MMVDRTHGGQMQIISITGNACMRPGSGMHGAKEIWGQTEN
jgi:hypothetical protein